MDFERLVKALEEAWCYETCYSGSRDSWRLGNQAIGQCAVTALVVQDHLGGKIAFGLMPEAETSHYWNVVAGVRLDLTWKQFEDAYQLPGHAGFRTRENLLENEDTKERYEILKVRTDRALMVAAIKEAFPDISVNGTGLHLSSSISEHSIHAKWSHNTGLLVSWEDIRSFEDGNIVLKPCRKDVCEMSPEDRIVDLATGFVDGYERALAIAEEEEIEDLDDWLLDHGIERCPSCEWYVESGELIPPDTDDPDGFCENCRPSVGE